jgi:hypothetical protein
MQQPDPRPFQAIKIGLASVETGEDRFSSNGYVYRPPVARYRCNLTALSQRYNLYFVAVGDHIAVYQPSFPFQKLSRDPALRIKRSLAEPEADGYLDRHRPHAVNHLIVGDLGTEEILLLSTDSGNVAAYHTKAIEEAIYRNPYKFSTAGWSDFVGLRPFFTHWVEESAWGLAIHTAGRMVAVSANKPYHWLTSDSSAKITVFAFALTNSQPSAQEDDMSDEEPDGERVDWYDWTPQTINSVRPSRDRNFKITLGGRNGHVSNIPSISFINTSEDPDGSWLLSTDITGATKLWRIWQGICHITYDCGGHQPEPDMGGAGWIVAALDPSAFRPAYTKAQFCGHDRPRPAAHYQGNPAESYDITNIVRLRTPGRSQNHPALPQESDDEEDDQDAEEINSQWSDEEEEESEEQRKRELVLGLRPLQVSSVQQHSFVPRFGETRPPSAAPTQITGTPIQVPDSPPTQSPWLQLVYDDYDDDATDDDFVSEPEVAWSSAGSPASQHTQTTSVDLDSRGHLIPPPSESVTVKPPPTLKRPRYDSSESIRVPMVAVMHCSKCHVRLILVPKARSPHFFCANILKQDLPDIDEHRSGFLTRLSMVQTIPELGIVVIGSQLGRVAVCTLTKNMANGALGFRVDWILPTKRQEREGQRPGLALLGIAVAPIQGRQRSVPETENAGAIGGDWARDRTIHGVRTTFDHRVLVLDGNKTRRNFDGSSSDESSHIQTRTSTHRRRTTKSQPKPIRKRPRHLDPSKGSTASSSRTQQPSPPHTSSSASSQQVSEGRASFSSLSSQASTQSRPFPALTSPELWEAVEPSRRYRLMLTYLDSSVLTYELERGVERDDICRPSIYEMQADSQSGLRGTRMSRAAPTFVPASNGGASPASHNTNGIPEEAVGGLADDIHEYVFSDDND